MSGNTPTVWPSRLSRCQSLLKTGVILLPILTVGLVILQEQLEHRRIPLGFGVLAIWGVLLLSWGGVSYWNGARMRFSMRGLLIFIALIACAAAMALHVIPALRSRRAIVAITKAGGSYETEPTGPAWVRRLFGDEYSQSVTHVNLIGRQFTDDDMVHIAALTDLRNLWLGHTAVTDEGLRHVAGLTKLEHLDLPSRGDGKVTDDCFAYLRGLKKLRHFDASDTLVRDEGLVHLAGLTNLEKLELENTDVTDDGLMHLRRLTRLRSLRLDGTKVTRAAEDRLMSQLRQSLDQDQ